MVNRVRMHNVHANTAAGNYLAHMYHSRGLVGLALTVHECHDYKAVTRLASFRVRGLTEAPGGKGGGNQASREEGRQGGGRGADLLEGAIGVLLWARYPCRSAPFARKASRERRHRCADLHAGKLECVFKTAIRLFDTP